MVQIGTSIFYKAIEVGISVSLCGGGGVQRAGVQAELCPRDCGGSRGVCWEDAGPVALPRLLEKLKATDIIVSRSMTFRASSCCRSERTEPLTASHCEHHGCLSCGATRMPAGGPGIEKPQRCRVIRKWPRKASGWGERVLSQQCVLACVARHPACMGHQ